MYAVPHRVETERLVLRRYVHDDAEALATLIPRNLDHLGQYMEWTAFEPQTVDQRRAWIAEVAAKADAGEDFTLGIFLLAGTLVGGTGFHVRTEPDRLAIGYWIDAEHEGRGLVTEAVTALTRVALELTGADLVDISHAPSNVRSAAIPQRLGFHRQDATGEQCFDSGCQEPSVTWFATRADLARQPLASAVRPRAVDRHGDEIPWPP
ncbi:GNAT family N-acetyltransferase [Demequina activiva]|uniref:N-acetyltransferase domain-containing protein n=1 Tax=Demequina activiva TaxID=1582364 RepID=A0A919UFX9_9MICO|nr:GNAT family N-acetyltransferase [Demequina activiva]GIG54237.1 hypothetical protein Dac01nite_09890 [Demequina activiva]